MKIYKINNHLVDVFTGDGWTNWCRFQVNNNHLKMVAGAPLSSDDFSTVLSYFRKK